MDTLTAEQAVALQKAAHIALARQEFLAYATYIDRTYETPPHIHAICGKLQELEAGITKRLIITLPPRHGKSDTATGKFPGWCLGRDPTRTVIITSYAATLAEKFSEQNRDTIMLNERYRDVFPGVSVNPNKKRKDNWCLMGRTESVKAAGVGGGISGFGAWLLLIDDPIKDAEQASSPTHNQKVWEWFQTTSRTRLAPGGRIVVIMTRWAEGDLVDRILESEEAEDWDILHLPATSYGTDEEEWREPGMSDDDLQQALEAIPDTAFPDPLGREKGKALWPARFDEDWSVVTKSVMGHHFTALYQGHPTEPAGHEFKREWFRLITGKLLAKLQAKPVRRARSWDIAWSSSKRADWTVCLRATLYEIPKTLKNDLATNPALREFGMSVNLNLPPLMLVIEDVKRWQNEWDETSALIIQTAGDDTNKYRMLIEAVASQNVAFKSIAKELRLWKHNIIPVVPDKDKEVRAKLALKLASLGCVFLLSPEDGSYPIWAKDFLKELGDFASGRSTKDDQVDALTQVVNYWSGTIDRYLIDLPVQYLKTPFTEKRLPDEEPKPIRETIPEFQMIEDPFNRVDGLGWRVIA